MGPSGWTKTPTAMPCLSSVNRWKGREGLGRLREGACNKVSRRMVKAFRISLGDVRGPAGVSLAASYSGLASRAKLGTQCLKNPTSPKKREFDHLLLGVGDYGGVERGLL